MMRRNGFRTFSLLNNNSRKKRGSSRFSNFLAGIGRAVRPILRNVAKGATNFLTNQDISKFGKQAINMGSEALTDLARGKSLKDVATENAKRVTKEALDAARGRLMGGGTEGISSLAPHMSPLMDAMPMRIKQHFSPVPTNSPIKRKRKRSSSLNAPSRKKRKR